MCVLSPAGYFATGSGRFSGVLGREGSRDNGTLPTTGLLIRGEAEDLVAFGGGANDAAGGGGANVEACGGGAKAAGGGADAAGGPPYGTCCGANDVGGACAIGGCGLAYPFLGFDVVFGGGPLGAVNPCNVGDGWFGNGEAMECTVGVARLGAAMGTSGASFHGVMSLR